MLIAVTWMLVIISGDNYISFNGFNSSLACHQYANELMKETGKKRYHCIPVFLN